MDDFVFLTAPSITESTEATIPVTLTTEPAAETQAVTAAIAEPLVPAEPVLSINPSFLWAGCGLIAGAVLALIGCKVASLRKKSVHREGGGPISIQVGKLHQQGAREYQQDSFSVSDPAQYGTRGVLAVIADGMGGLESGDQVSQCAVNAMMEQFHRVSGDPMGTLLSLLETATAQVNGFLGEENYYKSGTTLIAGLIREDYFYYLSVGDSRISLFRDGQLYQLNREHIFRHDLIQKAVNRELPWDQAMSHPKAAGLTSFLGMGSLKHIDIPAEPVEILPGDKFVLMSDGVYNAVTRQELVEQLKKGPEEAAEGLHQLIESKNLKGQDNYTAIILSC